MTHGGVKIAVSLAKKDETVYAYDIYNTLKSVDKKMLAVYNVKIIDLDYLNKNTAGFSFNSCNFNFGNVIAPVFQKFFNYFVMG